METKSLTKTLNVGILLEDGKLIKELELLRTNGVAEKVYTAKVPERPYTWMANVLTIAIARIGTTAIGMPAREEHLKSGSFEIHPLVKRIPIADVLTLITEIHRTVWQPVVPKQEIYCKFCAKTLLTDVDLCRLEYSKEDMELIEAGVPTELLVSLPNGFHFEGIKGAGQDSGKVMYEEYAGQYNRAKYRIPTLGDALRCEKSYADTILFWRNIAATCLEHFQIVTENGEVMNEMPRNVIDAMGTRLYDLYLDAIDLRAIRHALRESLPILPMHYLDNCGCPENREIPITVDASGFFTD